MKSFIALEGVDGAGKIAKKWIMQKKELLAKVLAYHIHRLVQLSRM